MTPRLSGHFSIFGLVFFLDQVYCVTMGREKLAILSLKPRGHVRVLIYREWAITLRLGDFK